ncbi:MAG: TonB-dependent receptor domain-containing protein [Phenylobacterium sp.]
MRRLRGALAAGGLIACGLDAAAAQAQTEPKAKPAPAETHSVQGVTVTAGSEGLRTSIDRRSYDVSKDLQAQTGSIGDALRSIPSVEVDAQGNISLRGDPNVTIMIDGKPSGLFTGAGRAAALQSLPADQVARVEVITNPSADLSPEGSAGVINLITKQIHKPGLAGSVRGAFGSEARETASVNGAYNTGRLTLSADANLRRDPQKYTATVDRRSLDPATGAPLESHSRSEGRGRGHIIGYHAAGDFDLDKATRLNAEVRRTSLVTTIERLQRFQGDASAAAPALAFRQAGPLDITHDDTELSTGFRRSFAGDGHTLSGQLRFDETDNDYRQAYQQSGAAPPGSAPFNASRQAYAQAEGQLKVDYARPLPGEAKLKTGLDVRHDDDVFTSSGAIGADAGSAVADSGQTNRFHYVQTIAAAYVTYERPIGELTVLAGLRLEDVRIETHEFSGGLRNTRETPSAYPSLHLAWKLDEARQLTASYSRRVQRPYPSDLNPFATSNNFIFRAGNPNLEPQETDSYEAAWQYRNGPTNLIATLYWRDSRKLITDVGVVRPDGALLLTRVNAGRSRSGGLELVASGKLTSALSYNVSATLSWTEIDGANLGFVERRQATTLGGRGSLNWQPTPDDFAQISGFLVGDRLTPQGRQTPVGMLNLGWRHKLSDRLSLVATANDVLASLGGRVILATPTLHDVTRFTNDARAVFIGFTYAFGGQKAPRDPGFDFGGGPGGA